MEIKLPHSKYHEESIIADMMLFGADKVAVGLLVKDDFYFKSHWQLFKIMSRGAGKSIDDVILEMVEVKPIRSLLRIIKTPVPSSMEWYCNYLRKLSKRRRAISAMVKKIKQLSTK